MPARPRSHNYFRDSTTTAAFVVQELHDMQSGVPFISQGFTFTNDSTNDILVGFPPKIDTKPAAIVTAFRLRPGDIFGFDHRQVRFIAVMSAAGGDAYRFSAWS